MTGGPFDRTPVGTDWAAFFAHHDTRGPRPFALAGFDLADQLRNTDAAAIDLGCGQGTETAELLRRGWSVLAIDAEPEAIARVETLRTQLGSASTGRLATRLASFSDLDELPPASLVHAGFSLPFCPPDHFPTLWAAVEGSVGGGGVFVGQLFGDRDTWATTSAGTMTFHSRSALDRSFSGWELLRVDEQDEDGNSLAGPKHWHVFHVIARRR